MSDYSSLANHFLIAMPTLADPNFERTVTLICQHNEEGALGIVINRTIDLTMGDVFSQLELPADRAVADAAVHYGGPVQTERGLVLHENVGTWDSTLAVSGELALTTSRDVLEAMADNRGPPRALLALGYAGWGGGQLEAEITENAWLNGPASLEIIFDTPVGERWPRAAALVGVDLATMSREAGHA